ncbi:hypothetical protein V8E53_006195 [Lactarius tabidus]
MIDNEQPSPYRHSICSNSPPTELSPGGSSHGLYNGSDIIQGTRPRHETTINMLSDDILLEIFDFCKSNHDRGSRYVTLPEAVWDWHILVHVCQKWRQVVFASPHRLNLRILCTHGTPVRKNLDIWPHVPIHIEYLRRKTIEGIDEDNSETIESIDEDNIIVALEHPDRVCSVGLDLLTGSQLRKVTTVMLVPFPALRYLFLSMDDIDDMSNYDPLADLPCELFERSVPRLQKIGLIGIPFPALPSLLLSTSDLVWLELLDIPETGYFPPQAMVAALAASTGLEDLHIGFRSPVSRPDEIYLPSVTRTVLPALTRFEFRGAREYLEHFVAQIHAPRLYSMVIEYFNQVVDFEIPQFWQFIDHSEALDRHTSCTVAFGLRCVSFLAGSATDITDYEYFDDHPWNIDFYILCEGIDWQVSHISHAFNQISTMLSNVVHFAIKSDKGSPDSESEPEGLDDIEWLHLLRPFSAAKTLFVSRKYAGHVSRSLESITAVMATEVLPALDMLYLEDQPVSSVHKFIAARSESGRPVTTVNTRETFEEGLKSYSN